MALPRSQLKGGLLLIAVRVAIVGPAEHVAAARLGGPIFPGPPGFRRIGAVTAVAGVDLALGEILDLAAQLLGPHQGAGVVRQIDRHAYHLDGERPAEAKPWPRIRATLFLPRHLPRSRACAMLGTSTLGGPTLSAISQTGT